MPPQDNRPSLSFYTSVALVSAAVLGFEVSLTRVFAVLLRYQFAFLVISLALCGLGLGGLVAHFAMRRGRHLSLERTCLAFGYSTVLALLLILRVIFAYRPDQFWLAAMLVLVPFAAAGAFLSEAFSRYTRHGGQLYAWDLAGAAVAAAGSVALMQLCGAIDACLLFGALGGIASLYVARKPSPAVLVAALLLIFAWPINQVTKLWHVMPIPPMADARGYTLADRGVTQPLYTELGDPSHGSRIHDTRWNAFARTDVVLDPTSPNSFLLYTNGNVPTNMMGWDGKSWTLNEIGKGFSLSDWSYASSRLKDGEVLAIGPGGGLDALLALRYGAAQFDGAEINPSIVGLVKEPKYAAFNGGIYSHPKVNVRTAEGRAFVREQHAAGKRYRLVFSALTKTATAGQGMALLESFIYTQDAFHDYLNALEDEGTLAIVGDAPGNYPVLLSRLLATAVKELGARGLSQEEAGRCIAIVFNPLPGPYQWSLLVRKKPFSRAETFTLAENAFKRQLQPWWIPNQAAVNDPFPYGALLTGQLPLDTFIANFRTAGLDMSPCPDNRPFVLDMSLSPYVVFLSSPSLSILLGLSILGTVLLAAWSLRATARSVRARGGKAGEAWRPVIYFLCLGVGFMLVEIPLIQKLILPLGYPTLSLTIILFALLLGGGAGAMYSQRYGGTRLRRHATICALGVVLGSGAFALSAAHLGEFMLSLSLTARCALAIALLLPLGFLMGTPFPSGMRIFGVSGLPENAPSPEASEANLNASEAQPHSEDAVPLIWALNGTASVVGSMAAAIGAKMGGFSSVLWVGAAIYALAAVLVLSAPVDENS